MKDEYKELLKEAEDPSKFEAARERMGTLAK